MRKLLTALAVVVATLGVVSPADARTTSTNDAVLRSSGGYVGPHACRRGPAYFRLSVDESKVPDLEVWSADVTIDGPGKYHDTAFIYGPTDDGAWNGLWFCKRTNRAGTYTIRAVIDFQHTRWAPQAHTYEALRTTLSVRTTR
ncbi:hypothetical protein [Nocardioides montaniterrae]